MNDRLPDLAGRQGSTYDRKRDLPRLVPLWPAEIDDVSTTGRLRLLGKLRKALRAERQRGVAGSWCYDLARHRHLLTAYRAEVAAVVACRGVDRVVSASNEGIKSPPTQSSMQMHSPAPPRGGVRNGQRRLRARPTCWS